MIPLVGPTASPGLHVMTMNIRRRSDSFLTRPADRWGDRRDAVRELLSTEAPSVLAVQEALPDQAAFIGACLGGRYRRLGHGRLPGPHGEGCPLFYDAERLEILSAEQTALSDRPRVPGSRSWGNLFPRVLVKAKMRDRATSAVFTVLNTHLDPFGAASRVQSAAMINRTVAEAGSPSIVMGDFNADLASPALHELLDGGVLRDTWASAVHQSTPEWRTYGGYRRPRPTLDGRGRIDLILATADVLAETVAISTRRPQGRWPSDHLPVHAVLRLPPPEERS